MPKFSKISDERLNQCHPLLQTLMREVIKTYDCAILCGHRNKEDQEKAVEGGFSKVHFPNSKHNSFPSLAVDTLPSPVDFDDIKKHYHFLGYVQAVADKLGIKIRMGIDFNQNGNLNDDKFKDRPHVELVL